MKSKNTVFDFAIVIVGLLIVHEASRFVVRVELTCPWDTKLEFSHNYKQEKYSRLWQIWLATIASDIIRWKSLSVVGS